MKERVCWIAFFFLPRTTGLFTICVNNKNKEINILPAKGPKNVTSCVFEVIFHATVIVLNNSSLSKEHGKCALVVLNK